MIPGTLRKVPSCAVGECHKRQRHQHANHSRRCRARVQAERANSHRDSQFKEGRCADQRARGSDLMRQPPRPGPSIANRKGAVGLYEDRHCNERNLQGLRLNDLSLKTEQQHDGLQQSENRSGFDPGGKPRHSGCAPPCLSHGAEMSVTPDRKAMSGAKATTLIRLFTETCTRVQFASPLVSCDQTNTMAVQGAASSRISSAMLPQG